MSEKKIIEMELNGMALSQALLDKIWADAARATNGCDIILRNVATPGGGLPRLIVDYGQIYEAVEKLLKETGRL